MSPALKIVQILYSAIYPSLSQLFVVVVVVAAVVVIDFNECAEGLDDCDHNIECTTTSSGRETCRPVASCANTDGSYQCLCNAGYTGNGRVCTGYT